MRWLTGHSEPTSIRPKSALESRTVRWADSKRSRDLGDPGMPALIATGESPSVLPPQPGVHDVAYLVYRARMSILLRSTSNVHGLRLSQMPHQYRQCRIYIHLHRRPSRIGLCTSRVGLCS